MIGNEDEEWVATCGECHSDQSPQYMVRNCFAKEGQMPPCQYCGGVTFFGRVEDRLHNIEQVDRQRGLPQS